MFYSQWNTINRTIVSKATEVIWNFMAAKHDKNVES